MTTTDSRSYRLTSIDFLRGLVVVIMAIDHSRDFFFTSGVIDPMGDPNIEASLYLTRWITHFCAPVFVFLAGTSAGLMQARKSKKELGLFLLKRGLWLIFIEVSIISTGWTFAPWGIEGLDGSVFIALQVIWAIGASMVVLAAAQFLGARMCVALALLILVGQHMLEGIWPMSSGDDPLWVGLYEQIVTLIPPFYILTQYPLTPWIGVMLLGFGTSFVFKLEPEKRQTLLVRTGLVMIFSFIVLRGLDLYGDPNHWEWQSTTLGTFFSFMNVSKYPPSLLFLLATLGPMAILCGYADRISGWFKDTMVMFGRVPFIFYVAHIYLIHLMSVIFGVFQGFPASDFFTIFFLYPEGYGAGLLTVYIVWILVLLILYPVCRWMYHLKRSRKDWWLSYI